MNHLAERNSTNILDREIAAPSSTDLLLYRNEADAGWSRKFVERIRGERMGNRRIASEHASWNLSGATDILAKAEKSLHAARVFGIVVSERMLRDEWPSLEKLLFALSELDLAQGRLVTVLKENVTMPPLLRLHEWVDFRDGHRFEDSIQEFLGLLRERFSSSIRKPQAAVGVAPERFEKHVWKTRALFLETQKVSERIVSNLFPAVEIPKEIFSAESRFGTEAEVRGACGAPGPLPFLLQNSRLYGAAPIAENSVFGRAVKENGTPSRERFTEWLSDPERAPRAVELLNRLLRYHAWKRGLRFDEGQKLFYFTRSKPKKLWWEIGGQTIEREVTAPHIQWNQIDAQVTAEFQCGWKHEAIRAEFVHILGGLYLRLEPAWFLTELDGKTPATSQPVGPVESFARDQDRNGQVLHTLRFWSAVLAKGHRELRVETGANPIRVRLTPASGSGPSVIPCDRLDLDALALRGISHSQLIPDLAPIDR